VTDVHSSPRKRVLIVDDSFIMRKLVSEIISGDPDFTIVGAAENGREALRLIRECKPDVVLLDIEMPEMSGLETLRRLGLRSKAKVVILSSLGQDGTPQTVEALRLGAAAVLAKPSGSISLDLQERKGHEILRVVRDAVGLPALPIAEDLVDPERLNAPGTAVSAGMDGPKDAVQETLLASLASGVLVFDTSGRLRVSNAAAGYLLGIPDLPSTETSLDALFDDYNAALGADLRDVIATGERLEPVATDYALPSGEWRHVRLSGSPLLLAGGGRGVLAVVDDLSREQEFKTILSRTMASDVADLVLTKGSLRLGGSKANASVLFCDIRDFTSLSEALGAEGTVKMLNEYFSFMEDILKGHGGVVDKYIGDAIMALFGVPVQQVGDADRAVQAGLAMLAALDILNADRLMRGQDAIKIGIGVGTGTVIAGNIGSPSRMNHTVIGDPVNVASRIESLTKSFGAEFLICGTTKAALSAPVPMRRVDLAQVKGQQAATALFEVLRPVAAANTIWLNRFEAGFEAYLDGSWETAERHLAAALDLVPQDKAAALLIDRCRRLKAAPPAVWNGVWLNTAK